MVMMVLRGERNLSAKALFRLVEAEQEVDQLRSSRDYLVEGLIDASSIVAKGIGQERQGRSASNVAVDYGQKSKVKLPPVISLITPSEEACRKLRILFGETLDTRLIALACLPEEFRTEDYLEYLSAESKARLTSAALDLVIRDWRTLAVKRLINPTGSK